MTNLLAATLDSLEAVATAEQSYTAMEQVENIWWTRKKALPSGKILLQRYLDTESYLIPWLLPEDENSNFYCKLFKPDPALSAYYEFRIDLNRKFLSETMDSTMLNHTITQNDFYRIINLVEDDQRNIEMKSAIRTQKANMRRVRKQHDVFWNQV
ncbi:MAG: DUF4056 domain-containing protein [Cyclobacteriaceae bacterium]|nr:DUF4056 domain-containing protein [Cyclobacteriaceae bacterium]